ncbi:MAG: hypothetical protein WCR68_00665 [Candidatus Dojkabacteria bacterium]|jgi:2-phosphoglycerate kinase|nr:hypothetical protein [Candidatus Dojkabacteria bacterium]
MSTTIKTFNKMWENKKITKPLAILYGGYAGTGKSTTCKEISKLIAYTTNLPTGIIRSSIGDYLTNEDIELITSHTYELYKVGKYINPREEANREEITNRFLKQIGPIAKAINSVISFAASEKQHIIIDGNHVFPGLIEPNPNIHIIEFYNKVTDSKQHLRMLCGPTHSRTLSEEEFITARILHDFTIEECNRNHKEIYDYNNSLKMVKTELKKRLKQIINQSL